MANVLLDTTDLSTLGFSVSALNGRALASWDAERVAIVGRDTMADTGGKHAATKTSLAGTLSSPTTPWASHTRANLLTALTNLKEFLDPIDGYKKLYISGDADLARFRWVRFSDMDAPEAKPGPGASIFKAKFMPLTLEFDNLEPYWRVAHATVSSAAAPPIALPNATKRKLRPRITLTLTSAISTSGLITLLTMGNGLSVLWDNITVPLNNNDKILIDSENLTVTRQAGGAGAFKDAIRAYTYTPALLEDGFPIIPANGGSITAKHASVGNISVDYDELYK